MIMEMSFLNSSIPKSLYDIYDLNHFQCQGFQYYFFNDVSRLLGHCHLGFKHMFFVLTEKKG